MSVMVGIRLDVDPARFEQVIAENAETVRAISERGRSKGAIHHMFLAGDGMVMVTDEWDTAEHFQEFWEESGADIGPLMAQAGVANQPEPSFMRPLDTADRF